MLFIQFTLYLICHEERNIRICSRRLQSIYVKLMNIKWIHWDALRLEQSSYSIYNDFIITLNSFCTADRKHLKSSNFQISNELFSNWSGGGTSLVSTIMLLNHFFVSQLVTKFKLHRWIDAHFQPLLGDGDAINQLSIGMVVNMPALLANHLV